VAAWPLFRACLALTVKPWVALAVVLLALVHPMTLNAAATDFHEVALAAPLMAGALWALAARRFGWLIVALGGLALTKEHFGLSAVGCGLAWTIMHRDPKRGIPLATVGLVVFGLVFSVIMPAL